MPNVTLRDGAVVIRDGKVGIDPACCCDDANCCVGEGVRLQITVEIEGVADLLDTGCDCLNGVWVYDVTRQFTVPGTSITGTNGGADGVGEVLCELPYGYGNLKVEWDCYGLLVVVTLSLSDTPNFYSPSDSRTQVWELALTPVVDQCAEWTLGEQSGVGKPSLNSPGGMHRLECDMGQITSNVVGTVTITRIPL